LKKVIPSDFAKFLIFVISKTAHQINKNLKFMSTASLTLF